MESGRYNLHAIMGLRGVERRERSREEGGRGVEREGEERTKKERERRRGKHTFGEKRDQIIKVSRGMMFCRRGLNKLKVRYNHPLVPFKFLCKDISILL
jgi:hypothetical protein